MNIPEPISQAVAEVVTKIPEALVTGVVELLRRIAKSPDPKEALARALQVTAHEEAADAAVDALFAAKRKIVGTGE